MSNFPAARTFDRMVTRGDILWLGIASGVTGGLIGGMMLALGTELVLDHQPIGLAFICVGGPASGIIGWLLARRLARRLDHEV